MSLLLLGTPRVSSSFNRFMGVHPGLGLGADVDELEQHPSPWFLHTWPLCSHLPTSVKPRNAEDGTYFQNIPERRLRSCTRRGDECAWQEGSELCVRKSPWHRDLSSACGCLRMPQGWAALGPGSGLCPRAAQTLPQAMCSILPSTEQDAGGSGGFPAALILGNMRD